MFLVKYMVRKLLNKIDPDPCTAHDTFQEIRNININE